jgi:hypothetical protein|tara:strand:- start:522 stop:707 length:186 start_codon:yes stop_codon:yes gene_type:complete
MLKDVFSGMVPFLGKLRPQIFVAIVGLCVLAVYGINNEMNEIATGCIGGITGLGFKLLEGE